MGMEGRKNGLFIFLLIDDKMKSFVVALLRPSKQCDVCKEFPVVLLLATHYL